jgi:hypothetical protein
MIDLLKTILTCLAPIWLLIAFVLIFRPQWILKKEAPQNAKNQLKGIGYIALAIFGLLALNSLF